MVNSSINKALKGGQFFVSLLPIFVASSMFFIAPAFSSEVDFGLDEVLGPQTVAAPASATGNAASAPTASAPLKKSPQSRNIPSQNIPSQTGETNKGLEAVKSKLSSALSDNRRLQSENETLKKSFEEAAASVKILKLQLGALQKELAASRAEVSRLSQYKEIDMSLDEMRKREDELQASIDDLSAAERDLRSEVEKERSELASLKSERVSVNQSILELSKLQSGLVERLHTYPEKIKAYRQAISSLRKDFEEVKAWNDPLNIKLLTIAEVQIPSANGPVSTPSAYLEYDGRVKRVLPGSTLGKWLVSEISLNRVMLTTNKRTIIITASPVVKKGHLSGTAPSSYCAPPSPLDPKAEAAADKIIKSIEKRFPAMVKNSNKNSATKPSGEDRGDAVSSSNRGGNK